MNRTITGKNRGGNAAKIIFIAVVILLRGGREKEGKREGERIKGKEDVVKTRAPKRLT